MNCQSFMYGCCGCCVNMRWSRLRILRYLEKNTMIASRVFPDDGQPTWWVMIKMHWLRGGFLDHLFMTLLVMPTFGLSALFWRFVMGSCCFAGYIDRDTGRVGCLIHPEQRGLPDLRTHAFPLVPTLGCNRELRCPMLEAGMDGIDAADVVSRSRKGQKSLVRK